ncbi:hypothetical protein BKA83DRAFT_4415554 [Pisolithus microcarpus]|nr:hypothetical protein BKA83DRAFT_4415554 [Pisolithus microcarpus]
MVWNTSVIALHVVSNASWSARLTVGNSQMVMEQVEGAFQRWSPTPSICWENTTIKRRRRKLASKSGQMVICFQESRSSCLLSKRSRLQRLRRNPSLKTPLRVEMERSKKL